MGEHAGIDVDRHGPSAVGRGDLPQGLGQAAAVVDVAVGEGQSLDAAHIDAEAPDIVRQGVGGGPGVEQHAATTSADVARHRQGDAPAGAAEVIAGEGFLAGGDQIVDFARHPVGEARHAVADVVEQHEHLGPVEGLGHQRFVWDLCGGHPGLLRLSTVRPRHRRTASQTRDRTMAGPVRDPTRPPAAGRPLGSARNGRAPGRRKVCRRRPARPSACRPPGRCRSRGR